MKQEFYESKNVLLVFLIELIAIGGLLRFMLWECQVPLWVAVFFMYFLISFFVKRYQSAQMPYVTLDDLKIEHDHQPFLWTEIKRISLTPRLHPMAKSYTFFLKIEHRCGYDAIDLKYFSDKDRRALLDAVEKHIPVQYDHCKYESNFQKLCIWTTAMTVVFCWFCLLFYTYMNALHR